MKREDAKKMLEAIGIETPTEEQITTYLNQVNGETAKEKSRADGYKADAQKAADLQKQLDDIENSKKSDLEKLQAQYDALVKKDALNTARATASQKLGLSAEEATKYVKDDGTYDMDFLSEFITSKATAAATAKEQEIAGKQGNPGGGKSSNETEKTSAEKIAESVGKSMASTNKTTTDVLANYIS